ENAGAGDPRGARIRTGCTGPAGRATGRRARAARRHHRARRHGAGQRGPGEISIRRRTDHRSGLRQRERRASCRRRPRHADTGGADGAHRSAARASAGMTVEKTMQDIRYALRLLVKSPGYALAAIAALAIGVGANTAVFSIVNGVLVKSFPYRDPSKL